MGIDVRTETVIQRPRAEVAAYVADPDNAPAWYENIKSVEWRSPKSLAVGARVAFVAHFLGRVLKYTYEIKDYVPGKRLVMGTVEGPFPMETTYTWDDAGPGATKMTLRNRGGPTGFSSFIAPFMAIATRRATTKDLANLKRVLERGQTASPSPSEVASGRD
jgi:uncharacterized protein YndB with AHSA1/START domain